MLALRLYTPCSSQKVWKQKCWPRKPLSAQAGANNTYNGYTTYMTSGAGSWGETADSCADDGSYLYSNGGNGGARPPVMQSHTHSVQSCPASCGMAFSGFGSAMGLRAGYLSNKPCQVCSPPHRLDSSLRGCRLPRCCAWVWLLVAPYTHPKRCGTVL